MIIYLIRAFCGINFMSVTEDYLTASADFPQQKHSMIYVSFQFVFQCLCFTTSRVADVCKNRIQSMIFQININIIPIVLSCQNYTLISRRQTIAHARKTDIDMNDYPSKKTMLRQIAALLPALLLALSLSACKDGDSGTRSFPVPMPRWRITNPSCALSPNGRLSRPRSLFPPSWSGKPLTIR